MIKLIKTNEIRDHEKDFGDCTKCIHSQQTEPHVWECDAEEYDIDTKSCWRPRNKENETHCECEVDFCD